MKRKKSLLNNSNSSNDSSDNTKNKPKSPEEFVDLLIEGNISNSSKIRLEKTQDIIISSPFPTDEATSEENFDEKQVKKQLCSIIPIKDHHFIDHIINDKNNYYPNNLTIEKGIFRDTDKGMFLGVVNGTKDGFNIPKYVIDIGANNGLSIMSHNHINGLVIPSTKDMIWIPSLQSKYNPIYSPNKTGILVNSDVSLNNSIKEEIFNEYNEFMNEKEILIQKLYPEKTKILKDNYSGQKLKEKLKDDLYRPYFTKNHTSIAKEINKMFKENKFKLKLYIL